MRQYTKCCDCGKKIPVRNKTTAEWIKKSGTTPRCTSCHEEKMRVLIKT